MNICLPWLLAIALGLMWLPLPEAAAQAQEPLFEEDDADLSEPDAPESDPVPANPFPLPDTDEDPAHTEGAGAENPENLEPPVNPDDDAIEDIEFDPSKSVVRAAAVVRGPEDEVTPKPVDKPNLPVTVPPPRTNGDPQEDLFRHASLLTKHGAWALARQQYQEYVNLYPSGTHAQAAHYGLAESYLNLGEADAAERIYRRLLGLYDQGEYVGPAAYRLANLFYERRNYSEALHFFNIAAQKSPKEIVRWSAAYYGAKSAQMVNQPRRARQLYEELANQEGDYRDAAVLELGRMDVKENALENALNRFLEIVGPQVKPAIRAEAITKAGLVYSKLERYDEARKQLEEILAVEGSAARDWHPLAFWGLLKIYYEQGDYQSLIDRYQNQSIAYSEEAREVPVLMMVAHAFRRLGKYREAGTLYRRVELTARPESDQALEAGYRKLVCLYKDDSPLLFPRLEQFLTERRPVASRNEYFHLARLLKAEALFNESEKTSKTWAEAAEAYRLIDLERIPEKFHANVIYKRGWAQVEAGEDERGIETFRTFLTNYAGESPELVPRVLAKRAEAYRKKGSFDQAIADYDEILRLSEDPELEYLAFQQKALTEVDRDNQEGVVSAFQALLEKYPEGKGTSEAHYMIGNGLFHLSKYKEALPHLEKARAMDEDAYMAHATARIVLCHWRLLDAENTAKEVDTLLEHEPDTTRIPPKLWTWLGVRFYDQGDYKAASRYLEKVATPDKPDETLPVVWHYLGQSLLMSEKYDEAVKPFDHYLASVSRTDLRAKALLSKATALYHVRQYEEARACAEEVLTLQKQGRVYGQAHILLGDIAIAQQDYETASVHYVVPAKLFKDAMVTPVALEKAAEAFAKLGDNRRHADYRRILREEWPEYKPDA